MKIITVISDKYNPGFFLLKTSCALQELNMVALLCEQDSFVNYRRKDELIKRYIHDLDDDEIVLFTDGYDSIALTGVDEILRKFHLAGTDLLFSAETCCYPDPKLEQEYKDVGNSPYKYLNSGGFIGKVGLLKEMLLQDFSAMEPNFAWSNQYLWTLRFLSNRKYIKLDTTCDIFCTFSPEIVAGSMSHELRENREIYSEHFYKWFNMNFIIENGRILNRQTNTWPCIAHFNGPSSCFLEDYHESLEILFVKIPGSKNIKITSIMPGYTGFHHLS